MWLPHHHFLLHWNPERFIILATAYPGYSRKTPLNKCFYPFTIVYNLTTQLPTFSCFNGRFSWTWVRWISLGILLLCCLRTELVCKMSGQRKDVGLGAWRNVNVVGRINEAAVRQARLVLGWVTVLGGLATLVSLPSHQDQLSLLPSSER